MSAANPAAAILGAIPVAIDQTADDLQQSAIGRVGSVLDGKWRLDALLGFGGMGAVYAATHRNGNRMAIKVLHARHCADSTLARRLEQEACVANSVDHPGVVRIFDDGRTKDGALYLIMELLDGEGLQARLAHRTWQVSPSEALGITWGLLDVLAAAHRQGIVHGDVKPENVFITRRGEIRLLDFGVPSEDVFGTPGYMAPEQALGRAEEVDPRTDLWAVGATLFRMLTGQVVHQAPSLIEQLVDAGTKPVPAFARVLPGVEPALAALLDRALAFGKAERYGSAAEMQDAVRLCALSGSWGVAPRVPGVSVDLTPLPVPAGPGSAEAPPAVVIEPTMRIRRQRRGGGKLLVLVGGAAMAAASLLPFADLPGRSVVPDGVAVARAEFPNPLASGQALIKLTPITRPVEPVPAATGVRVVGRRLKATRRSRPTSSVVADDDVWGRRH
jgi:eukaryotic-like serine/threonine-protein kinase